MNKFFLSIAVLLITSAGNTSCQVKETATTDSYVSTAIEAPVQPENDSLPKQVGYVNDFENIYTDEQETTLSGIIASFKKNTSIEIAIVSIDTTMTIKENLDAFTLEIANNWGVGEKNKNPGITIGISKGYRKMRIQNGNGVQHFLTDNETQEIVDNAFIPAFKKGNYFKGTLAGLTALTNTITKNLADKIKH